MNAREQAVLVDGVGNTREMWIHEHPDRILIPRPSRPARVFDAEPIAAPSWVGTFTRVGRLPDARVVYGLHFPDDTPQFALWKVTVEWVPEMPEPGLAALREHVEQEIAHLPAEPPVVRLYDTTTFKPAEHVFTRCVMGIGRKPVEA